jgi:hypothetical protein
VTSACGDSSAALIPDDFLLLLDTYLCLFNPLLLLSIFPQILNQSVAGLL